eukprot:m.204484 g.204484  ORF g.204484 m.204484 type:complete len:826 (+) comp18472_c1_seq1:2099-4576(+)
MARMAGCRGVFAAVMVLSVLSAARVSNGQAVQGGAIVCVTPEEIPGGYAMLVRNNVTSTTPKGTSWSPAVCTAADCSLVSVSMAPSGAAWGTNNDDKSLFLSMPPFGYNAWMSVAAPSMLVSVAGSDNHVLGLDAKGAVFVRQGISAVQPLGTAWSSHASANALAVAASNTLLAYMDQNGDTFTAKPTPVGMAPSWSKLPGPRLPGCLSLAQDGSHFACATGNGVYVQTVGTTKGWSLVSTPAVRAVTMTQYGQTFAVVRSTGAVLVSDAPGRPFVSLDTTSAANCSNGIAANIGTPLSDNTLSIVPQPASVAVYPGNYTIGNPAVFSFVPTGVQSPILTQALARYQVLTFQGADSKQRRVDRSDAGLDVLVLTKNETLGLETDESYTLDTGTVPHALLTANTVFGALRGLETFSQLVQSALSSSPQNQVPVILLPNISISDSPRFAYRGLMIDPARRFLPLKAIKAVLDGMSYEKLNVLHMHITDDQSFPLELKQHPELAKEGAFHPNLVYSADDVQELVTYARNRGIRIIPEIDTPGHSTSWSWSHPELATVCGTSALLNPTVNATYDLLADVWSEVGQAFPDDYVFLGGDEVSTSCWAADANVTAWLKEHGITVSQLQAYFEERLVHTVRGQGKQLLVWQEVFQHTDTPITTLGKDAVVSVWKGLDLKTLEAVTASGLRALLSGAWYLSNLNSGTTWGREWVDYYAVDPQRFNGTQAQKDLVLGGHACIWGEACDATNIIPRLWPRLSAVSERLWSPANVTDTTDAARRFHTHRCLMRQRGLAASPIGLFEPAVASGRASWQSRGWCPADIDFDYNPPTGEQ